MAINKQIDPAYKPGVDMSDMTNSHVPKEFVHKEYSLQKQVCFVLLLFWIQLDQWMVQLIQLRIRLQLLSVG